MASAEMSQRVLALHSEAAAQSTITVATHSASAEQGVVLPLEHVVV